MSAKKTSTTTEIDDLQAARAKRNETDQPKIDKEHQSADKNTQLATSENDQRSVKEGKQEQNIPKTNGQRHHRHWLWWLVGVIVLMLIGGGCYLLIAQPWASSQHKTGQDANEQLGESREPNEPEAQEPNDSGDPQAPETPAESKPPENQPPETKPADTGATKPSDDKTLPPIAQRPGSSDYPDITSNKLIALTFDDGPSKATTPRLLDVLNGRNVKATFFVLGNMALGAPDIVRREAAEGHEVASHTPYHNQLTLLNASQIRSQAIEMDRIFTDILGTVPPFTRPPYGSYNDTVRNALGQPLIIWSIDPRDWADRNASIVCSRVTSAAFDGAIILVHDIHATTVDAVPCIIDNLRAQGYQFLTVSELAAAKNVPLVNGGVYGSFR